MSTRSPACSWARSNRPCQAVSASIGTDAASTWVSRAGLGAIADGGAQQNSAVAPWAYQSFMPNTSWPTMPSAPTPTAAMAPENSWPGMAWRRFSPDLVCVVGCHNNSVPVTPTAWTRIKTSPRWGPGVLTSACTSPGTGRESSHCQTFILHLVVKVDSCSGQRGHGHDDSPSTGPLLGHARLGVLLRVAGLGIEFAGAMFPERDHPEQKCRGRRRPNGVVGRAFPPERTSNRQGEPEQQRRRRECPPMEPPPDQQSTRHNHFCSGCQDGRRRHQGWRQKPQELGGVGGEPFEVSPSHPGDAKWAPQAEAIGNRGEEREGQGHAKQPDREPAKLRLVEHGSSTGRITSSVPES